MNKPKLYVVFDKARKEYDYEHAQLAEDERTIKARFKYFLLRPNESILSMYTDDFALYEIVFNDNKKFTNVFVCELKDLKENN